MLITMLADTRGSEDGVTVLLYTAGSTVDVGPALAESFLGAGFAVLANSLEVEDEAPLQRAAAKKTKKILSPPAPSQAIPPSSVWE